MFDELIDLMYLIESYFLRMNKSLWWMQRREDYVINADADNRPSGIKNLLLVFCRLKSLSREMFESAPLIDGGGGQEEEAL